MCVCRGSSWALCGSSKSPCTLHYSAHPILSAALRHSAATCVSMQRTLFVTLVVTVIRPSDCETMSDEASNRVISWSHSFSWAHGSDGKMHDETQEVRRSFSIGKGVQEVEVHCRDGHCHKSVGFLAQRDPQADFQSVLLTDKVAMVPLPVRDKQLPQNLPKVFLDSLGKSGVRTDLPVIGQYSRPMCREGHWLLCFEKQMAFIFAAFIAILVGAYFVWSCRKHHRRVSARERPLQALAEPLAPAILESGEAPTLSAKCPTETCTAASMGVPASDDGVQMYLAGLYSRAETSVAKTNSEVLLQPGVSTEDGVSVYLSCLYFRTLA